MWSQWVWVLTMRTVRVRSTPQIGDQLAGAVEVGQVGRVDQYRAVRSVDEVVTVEIAPVNEEEIRKNFGIDHDFYSVIVPH
jgi:hypothetical protein